MRSPRLSRPGSCKADPAPSPPTAVSRPDRAGTPLAATSTSTPLSPPSVRFLGLRPLLRGGRIASVKHRTRELQTDPPLCRTDAGLMADSTASGGTGHGQG